MNSLNEYPIEELSKQIFSNMASYKPSAINQRIRNFEARLRNFKEGSVFISIGENCAAGVKLREARLNTMGSQFFDNIVVPSESLIRILDADFSDILSLRNLSIGHWEGSDSVYDERFGIFFHHYFHLRGLSNEKSFFLEDGVRRRRIHEEDIPLFLPAVRAQFEYLAAKFKMVLRSEVHKNLVVRRVDGDLVSVNTIGMLKSALHRFGGRNFSIAVVHSKKMESGTGNIYPEHHYIPENGVRWGTAEQWSKLKDTILCS